MVCHGYTTCGQPAAAYSKEPPFPFPLPHTQIEFSLSLDQSLTGQCGDTSSLFLEAHGGREASDCGMRLIGSKKRADHSSKQLHHLLTQGSSQFFSKSTLLHRGLQPLPTQQGTCIQVPACAPRTQLSHVLLLFRVPKQLASPLPSSQPPSMGKMWFIYYGERLLGCPLFVFHFCKPLHVLQGRSKPYLVLRSSLIYFDM